MKKPNIFLAILTGIGFIVLSIKKFGKVEYLYLHHFSND